MSSSLSDLPPDFAEAIERVRPRLRRVGSTILFAPRIGSTNDVALALAARPDSEGAVVTADEQTSGRGRRGRAWFSPPGSGLYVSVVLTPGRARVDPNRAVSLLTLAAGVALADGVEAATGLRAEIKWPNDLFVSRRKLAGILAEAAPAPPGASPSGGPVDVVVLGYGINVGPTAYPPDLSDRATSIESELGRRVDRATVFAETLACLSERYDDLLAARFDAILSGWRSRAPAIRGARVTWRSQSGEQAGVTAGIDESGALLVRTANRLERIVAGELTWF